MLSAILPCVILVATVGFCLVFIVIGSIQDMKQKKVGKEQTTTLIPLDNELDWQEYEEQRYLKKIWTLNNLEYVIYRILQDSKKEMTLQEIENKIQFYFKYDKDIDLRKAIMVKLSHLREKGLVAKKRYYTNNNLQIIIKYQAYKKESYQEPEPCEEEKQAIADLVNKVFGEEDYE
jgi:hypothetical protein